MCLLRKQQLPVPICTLITAPSLKYWYMFWLCFRNMKELHYLIKKIHNFNLSGLFSLSNGLSDLTILSITHWWIQCCIRCGINIWTKFSHCSWRGNKIILLPIWCRQEIYLTLLKAKWKLFLEALNDGPARNVKFIYGFLYFIYYTIDAGDVRSKNQPRLYLVIIDFEEFSVLEQISSPHLECCKITPLQKSRINSFI